MVNYGDITKIKGSEVPVVNVVIGGSPCQDLSIAGTRQGFNGERSSLFMEQVRVIKEMRGRDGIPRTDVDPRYMVWENVPGAFSSNSGEDFRRVLEETARITDSDTVIPRPPGGKWKTAGCILGDWWSIAWRVLDAQFWGVPQRRRRIALVADFTGWTAPEILFIRRGLQGDIAKSGNQETIFAAGNEKSFDKTIIYDNHGKGARITRHEISPTLAAQMGIGGNNCPLVIDTAYTNKSYEAWQEDRTLSTLKSSGGVAGGGSENLHIDDGFVRRITPLECERLQGFPDGWTDIGEWTDSKGKKRQSSDTARYKALGNSIAIPPWTWIIKRISALYEHPPTMASLFDGIGGFPLIWERINGKGTCKWISEIEEFPIAVTDYHFNRKEK